MKKKLNSVRVKLFLTLAIVVVIIIGFLILLNNFVLESFYLYAKEKTLMDVYTKINSYYDNPNPEVDIEVELEKTALSNNFDIIIKTEQNTNVYTTNKDFISSLNQISSINYGVPYNMFNQGDVLYSNENVTIIKSQDKKTDVNFIVLSGRLDNGYKLYIRMPISSVQESVKISNNFLYLVGSLSIIAGGIVVLIISKRFTSPIVELNQIARRMSNLDFSKKYRITDTDDEINDLGRNINIVSEKLEKTIRQLKATNIELERDIEKKSKIDEMRKQFISDVSHELKTPIALIQGYAEGLVENVTVDDESKQFYAEVILDEVNKMDKLVKQLLELMKLEYGKREFNNTNFNIIELIEEVIRKSKLMYEERDITIDFNTETPVYVYADEFYIEQVITNYFTNAIKHAEEVNGRKAIKIETQIDQQKNKVRITVFNTGNPIKEEDIQRIWNRFYKVDTSRNRENGGTGIGLSLVKAIMNNYQNEFGVRNTEDGVEFYIELDLTIEE